MPEQPTAPEDAIRDPSLTEGELTTAPTAEATFPPHLADHAAGANGAEADTATETEIWTGRTHWKHFGGRLARWVLANAVLAALVGWIASRVQRLSAGGAFWIILGVLLISGLVVVGRIVLRILTTRYRITSQRLFIERGLFTQTVDQTELIRVDDVRLKKTVLDRLFGLGSVVILTTDATDKETLIEGIAEPEEVAEAIRKHMRTMRKKSLFVENL